MTWYPKFTYYHMHFFKFIISKSLNPARKQREVVKDTYFDGGIKKFIDIL